MIRDKAVTLLGFQTVGTHITIKNVMKGNTKVHGEPGRTARYLGPQVSLYRLTTIEGKLRIKHLRRAWVQLGSIWKHRVPW